MITLFMGVCLGVWFLQKTGFAPWYMDSGVALHPRDLKITTCLHSYISNMGLLGFVEILKIGEMAGTCFHISPKKMRFSAITSGASDRRGTSLLHLLLRRVTKTQIRCQWVGL